MKVRDDRVVQLAMKGRILTPVSPLDTKLGSWTEFVDVWSGGSAKEPWDRIFIQAPVSVACLVFESIFEHNPRNVSCTCCGEEYSIAEAVEFSFGSNVLLIKAADILPEWLKPAALKGFTTHVAFFDDINFETKYAPFLSNSAAAASEVSETFLKQLSAELAEKAAAKDFFLPSMSEEALGKMEAEAGFVKKMQIIAPEKFKMICPDDVELFWSIPPMLKIPDDPPKESLPPGMSYAYDEVKPLKKKKK